MNLELPGGLSGQDAAPEGANELGTDQRRGLAAIIAEAGREPMSLLLLGAGAYRFPQSGDRPRLFGSVRGRVRRPRAHGTAAALYWLLITQGMAVAEARVPSLLLSRN
jgi:hypothetical protein